MIILREQRIQPIIHEESRMISYNNGKTWISYIDKGDVKMDDYRGYICLIDGEYLAKCVGQDFYSGTLTFEIEPDGDTFTRDGEYGIEIYAKGDKKLTFDDVKNRLRRL